MVDVQTEKLGEAAVTIQVNGHTLRADLDAASGGHDSAPDPHDLFDSALAACKALTATVYARAKGIPLERVETHVERDSTREKQGTYVLRVRLAFHGPMTPEQRARLHEIVGRCPVHKLMTTTDVVIETAPLDP